MNQKKARHGTGGQEMRLSDWMIMVNLNMRIDGIIDAVVAITERLYKLHTVLIVAQK